MTVTMEHLGRVSTRPSSGFFYCVFVGCHKHGDDVKLICVDAEPAAGQALCPEHLALLTPSIEEPVVPDLWASCLGWVQHCDGEQGLQVCVTSWAAYTDKNLKWTRRVLGEDHGRYSACYDLTDVDDSSRRSDHDDALDEMLEAGLIEEYQASVDPVIHSHRLTDLGREELARYKAQRYIDSFIEPEKTS
jgi:hypothetical protein